MLDYNILKKFNRLSTRINIELINCDPIGVSDDQDFANNVYMEYINYVPKIADILQEDDKSKDDLRLYIIDVLNGMLEYDPNNQRCVDDVNKVVNKLWFLKTEFSLAK